MEILLFIIAIILSALVLTLGLIFNIIMAWKVKDFWHFVKNFSLEVWRTIKNLFFLLAKWIDVLGNVVGGNMFKYFFIEKEYWQQSLYGKSGVTISTSTGQAFKFGYFTLKGYKFYDIINWVFGKTHCKIAYKKYIYIKNFNKQELTNKLLGY